MTTRLLLTIFNKSISGSSGASERDALPTISMRTVPEINDADVRNYEVFDKVHQFRDRMEDNDWARPLQEYQRERADVASTEFKLEYNLLCDNLRRNKIEQKNIADVRVTLRSVNELLKTFDHSLMELLANDSANFVCLRTFQNLYV